MTRGQRNRFENRKTFQTVGIRSFTKGDTELVRVVAIDNKTGKLNIEFWTRKITQLADKAFKRQTVVTN